MTKFTQAELDYFNRIKHQVEAEEKRRNRLRGVRNVMANLRGKIAG